MGKLKIEYIPTEQCAQLSGEDLGDKWISILRACEDYSEDVKNYPNESLIMPWWAFLSAKEAVNYHVLRHKIKVTFDKRSKDLLQTAKLRKSSFLSASVTTPIDEFFLITKLRKNGFIRSLQPEQIRNVKKLASLPAAATFSVPGAGKTTEALAYYFYHKAKETRLLIIGPKNTFASWEEQLEACAKDNHEKVIRLVGGEKNIRELLTADPSIMLITYHQAANVSEVLADYISKFPTFMFLDESHHIKKGIKGVIGKAILNISHIPVRKLILSGTPLPNSMGDLIPQLSFLYPEISPTEENVKDLIKPIYVRTTKGELKIPEVKRFQTIVPMLESQKYLYNLLKSEVVRQTDQALKAKDRNWLRNMGRSVMRLLQLISNPSLLSKVEFEHPRLLSDIFDEGDSPKLEYTCLRARELASSGKKVIIWSGFVENVEIIAERLVDLDAQFIHGGVNAGSEEDEDTREGKIRKFHDDENCLVMVANPAACSEGISLHTVCQYAIYLDRNYNAAQYLQSEDRIHRLGLQEGQNPIIEIVHCPDSLDDSVDRRLRSKVERMAKVLNDQTLNIDPISYDPDDETLEEEDLKDILMCLKGTE